MEVEEPLYIADLPMDQFEDQGVKYFVMGQPRWLGFFFHAGDRPREVRRNRPRTGSRSRPIHVRSVSSAYGRTQVNINTVRNLSAGLLGAYLPTFFGALSPLEVWAAIV